MNFGDYIRSTEKRLPRFSVKCAFCSMRASIGCHDCQAPLCKNHATLEVDLWKCPDHRARLVGESVKGELVDG